MEPQDPSGPVIVWFRQDLRIADHAALSAAAKTGLPVLPLYIYDEATEGCWTPGGASRWWLEGSLSALDEALRSLGSRLVLRRGRATEVLDRLVAETGAGGVYFTRQYEPRQVAAEKAVVDICEQRRVVCRRFGGSLLFEPEAIRTRSDGPFRVFTPFYKACLAAGGIKDPLPAPDRLTAPDAWPEGDNLKGWALRPTAPDWASGLRDRWQPGSNGASARLDAFLDNGLAGYPSGRDRPDRDGTSALSPHLHFGEVSPRQIWHRTRLWADVHSGGDSGRTSYLRELVWREFSCHLLHHFPSLPETAFNERFEAFPWRDDRDALAAWQQGRTGYPIVDAGMRQLWHTGWMHNRVRMIVASFLTKHLMIHWRDGARWFWDTLVDADLANNSASWQWVAGCGADAAPYFRIFNPILQGQKFDPDGAYVRRWVPELADLPDRDIHTPWKSADRVEGYPDPIVEHKVARQRALDAYKSLKDGRS